MKIKTATVFTAMTFSMIMMASPLSAGGNKDVEVETDDIPKTSVLHITDRPFGFGEGGGIGAGLRPEGFEEIPDGIISGESPKTVSAQLTTISGTLNVKGGKGKRQFTFKTDDGKSYAMKVPEDVAEHLANLKNKKLKAEGVFYGKDFLLFDFKIDEE